MMYARNLCQNCYMKNYGKEKRLENKTAKAAEKAESKLAATFSSKSSKKNTNSMHSKQFAAIQNPTKR